MKGWTLIRIGDKHAYRILIGKHIKNGHLNDREWNVRLPLSWILNR